MDVTAIQLAELVNVAAIVLVAWRLVAGLRVTLLAACFAFGAPVALIINHAPPGAGPEAASMLMTVTVLGACAVVLVMTPVTVLVGGSDAVAGFWRALGAGIASTRRSLGRRAGQALTARFAG